MGTVVPKRIGAHVARSIVLTKFVTERSSVLLLPSGVLARGALSALGQSSSGTMTTPGPGPGGSMPPNAPA